MKFVEFFLNNRVTTLFITAVIIFSGILSYGKLGRLEDPEFTIKNALVTTAYPGATAKEVEKEVTDKLEIAIQQLPYIKHIESVSKPGLSIIDIEMEDKYDKNKLPQIWDELRRKVNDTENQLPPGAGPPKVQDDYGDVFGSLFAITGKGYNWKELENYADYLKRELLLVPDVARVEIFGIQPQEIHLEISRNKLAQLGISPEQIFKNLAQQNLVSPAGQVKSGNYYLHIYPTGNFKSISDIGNLLISGKDATKLIYLKDIATISEGYKTPADYIVHFDKQPALAIGISVKSGGNVATLGENIKKKLKELQYAAPVGMQIHPISLQSEYVNSSIKGFVVSVYESLIIVILILIVFMGWQSSLLIGITLLLTILGTFVGMFLLGVSLERISLGALIIALGMLVDNAIVVNDGILVRLQQGEEGITAAIKVVKQTAMPLLGATLIAILAFAAIGLSNNSTGEYTRSLFQVISISLLLSWIVAVTVTPLLCLILIKPQKQNEEKNSLYQHPIFNFYRFILKTIIRRKILSFFILSIGMGFSIIGFTQLENSFFPDSTRDQFMVDFWLPEGTDIRVTEKQVKELENYIREIPDITQVSAFIGKGAPRFILTYTPEKAFSSYAFLLVTVKDYRTIDNLIDKIRQIGKTHFPNADINARKFILGPSKPNTLEVRFIGPDAQILRQLANQAKKIMAEDGNIVSIKDNWREQVPVEIPLIADSQARKAGINQDDINHALQFSYAGVPVGLFRDQDKLLPILAMSTKEEQSTLDQIESIPVWSSAAQKYIPLQQIALNFSVYWQDQNIQRRDRRLTITVQASQKSGNSSTALARIKPKIEALPLSPGYNLEWGGEFEKSYEAQKALFKYIPVVILLMILILVCLFNAIRQTTIIVLTVPLAVIGIVLGLWVTHLSFGFMALLGALSLSGMLIKNSIVLIDEIDHQIQEGIPKYQALIEASVSRVRPVSVAAITTVLGMIPLITDIFFQGMAVTIMSGLTFATILSLLVVPLLYSTLFSIKESTN